MKLHTPAARELVKQHLRSLEGRDRYLRFGHALTDDSINAYVDGTWNGNNEWFGIVEDNKAIAVVHVAIEGDNKAELGLSVDPAWRGKKLGQALFQRGLVFVRAQGVKDVFMHCLTENAAMKHIANKNHMMLFSSYGETDADLHIDPLPLDPMREAILEQMAIYDNNVRGARNAWKYLIGKENV